MPSPAWACLALLVFLFCYSVDLVGQPSVLSQRSPAMRVPMCYVYLAMPVGLGLMSIQSCFCNCSKAS